MIHEITIGGRPVKLAWTVESQKRFQYRLQTIGGHPPEGAFRAARTAPAAFCKVLWALLPPAEVALYPTPEDVFVALDHETEAGPMFEAISAIYGERAAGAEKKTTSGKSPSPASSSD